MNTLLEINLLLSLLYLGYYLFLRNLTFFRWTRAYLLLGMISAVLYPLLRANQVVEVPAEALAISLPTLYAAAPTLPWETWTMYALAAVSAVLLGRLILQFVALRNIHKQTQKAHFEEHEYQDSNREIKPFSFLRWIYIHSESHSRRELTQILKHEEVHVREMHTLDVLVAECCRILCWYNPVVHLLNRAVKDNLEFGVDRLLIHTGIDKVAYQHSLVGIALNKVPHPYPGNQFAFTTLKRRILMMNRTPSHRTRLFNYAFLMPGLMIGCIFLHVSCQKETVESVAKPQSITLSRATADTVGRHVITVEGKPVTQGRVAGIRSKDEMPIVEGHQVKEITVEGMPVVEETEKSLPNAAQVSGKNRDQASLQEVVVTGKPMRVRGTVEGRPVLFEGKPVGADRGAVTVVGMPAYNSPNIVIRGTENANPETKPLIIFDGEEINHLNDIKPEDIESISVFKGESAQKTYGAKAKNGVLVIRSKSSTRH